jgi:hypothetical protein
MSLAAVGPLLSGGAALFSALRGNKADNTAANLQYALGQDQLRFNQQAYAGQLADSKEQRAQQQAIADIILRRGVAGQTDGMGGGIFYDETSNTWKTIISPEQRRTNEQQRSVTDAQVNEELIRLAVDQPARRRGMQANETRRAVEGREAEAALARYKNTPEVSREGLRGTLMQQGANGVNRAFDDTTADISRQAVRAGTGMSNVVAELARKRGEALRDANIDAEIKSYNVDGINQGRRNANLGEYTTLAERASNFYDAPLAPSNQQESMLAAIANRIGGSIQSGTGAAYANGSINAASGYGTGGVNTGFNSAIQGVKPVNGANIGGAAQGLNAILTSLDTLITSNRDQGKKKSGLDSGVGFGFSTGG